MAEVKIAADSGGGSVGLVGPASTTGNAAIQLKLPVADGSAGQVLTTNGSGTLSFNSSRQITSVTGSIIQSVASNLTIVVVGITGTVSIKYYQDGILKATVASQSVSGGSITTAVPAAVYGLADDSIVYVEVVNSDGLPSNNRIAKTVAAVPTGGTRTNPSGTTYIHVFNSSSTFVTSLNSLSVEYLIIAGGGGGGGYQAAGGGGAGGYLTATGLSMSAATYTVTVGAGGAGGADENEGSTGSNSVLSGSGISTLTAIGGGGGGSYTTDNSESATDGGSGGGAQGYNASAIGDGTSGQGNDGGQGSGDYGNNTAGGGGGGAGAVGTNGSSAQGGHGGAGTASSITGSSVTRGGGGGGAGFWGTKGNGGTGGGGYGATDSDSGAQAGTANTGGGGGGTSDSGAKTGGAGGSGVIILKYTI